MKSEKADAKLKFYVQYGRGIDGITYHEAVDTILIAEKDAEIRDKERAIKAYCEDCRDSWNKRVPYDGKPCEDCYHIKNFLRHYDA